MSDQDQDDDQAGYNNAPKRSRWKSGESGNRRREYPKRTPHPATLIDRLLLKKIEITIRGKKRKVTVLEAILRQLSVMEIQGDPRALKVRMKYQAFARQFRKPRIETVFVDNDYTAAMSAIPLSEDKNP
jgi:hypothetical protein